MNKKLLVVAIGAALAAPAFAQSSNVTLYGRIHQGIESVSVGNGASGRNVVGLGSRLGVRGSEDIGGGTKAIFGYELNLSSDEERQAGPTATTTLTDTAVTPNAPVADVAASTTVTNTNSGVGSTRNAYVGLDFGSNGRAVIGILDGTINAPLYSQISRVVTDINHDVGTAQFSSARTDTLRGNQRVSDALGYEVTLSNVQVQTRLAMGGDPKSTTAASATNGEQAARNFSIAASTKAMGLDLGLGYERDDNTVKATENAAAAFKNRVQGTVGYTAGPIKAGLVLARNNFSDATRGTTNLQDSENEYGLSFAYAVTDKSQAILNHFSRDIAGTASAERRQTQLGYKYNFSKRTMGYALYQRLDQNSTVNSDESKAIIAGIRHNF